MNEILLEQGLRAEFLRSRSAWLKLQLEVNSGSAVRIFPYPIVVLQKLAQNAAHTATSRSYIGDKPLQLLEQDY